MRVADFPGAATVLRSGAFRTGALGAALCIVLALSAILGAESRKSDTRQIAAETARLEGALGVQLAEQARDLARLALARNTRADATPMSFDRFFPADRGADPATGPILQALRDSRWDRAARNEATASLPETSAPSPAVPVSATGFAAFDGRVYAATSVPGADGRATIGLRRIDEAFLERTAARAGLGRIRLAQNAGAAGDAGLRVIEAKGDGAETGAALVWEPARPGDTILVRYGLMLLGATILIAAALIWQARAAIAQLGASEARARAAAGNDPLTGLPNRVAFSNLMDAEIARSGRGGRSLAYLAIDIDRLKETNDSFGHDAGDRMICGIAERMAGVLRPGDRLARIDGDEFAILQTEIAGPADCEELATRMLDVLKAPLDLGDMHMCARISIGMSLFPADARNRQGLMQCALQAQARAQSEGRNRFAFFEKKLGDDMRARKTTESELRAAIEGGDLRVYYQPIMSADGERMACVEALVRWQHAVHGLVPPDHFIALAEDRGLIVPLGEWVLRQACRDGRNWPGLSVAVNVSPVQFRDKGFAAMVERVLAEEGFPASQLELELTEGGVIVDAEQAENVMMDLRGLGVRMALDDFGTGYSSLVYLRRFAFDKIKIDRSFLEAMEPTGESAIIVHSIVHLGRALGLTVTAEGIETAEQHRFLQAAGAHELQGFLFSKPVLAAQISEFLAGKSPQRDAA